ncbi:MAG: hypothetical protein ACJ0G7_00375 [Parasynechococcus sp.]|uniref:hypothetical protein n=1 Tax=Parasynechococcus sp. TaxID=3101203 RepID=UPI003889CEDE
MASPADPDVNLKRALEQLGQNEAAVAEAINEARAEQSRTRAAGLRPGVARAHR